MQGVDALLGGVPSLSTSHFVVLPRPRAESKTASAAARHQERCGCGCARARAKHTRVSSLSLYALMSFVRFDECSAAIYVLSIMYSVHFIHGIPPMAQRPRGRRRLPPDAPNLASACDAVWATWTQLWGGARLRYRLRCCRPSPSLLLAARRTWSMSGGGSQICCAAPQPASPRTAAATASLTWT